MEAKDKVEIDVASSGPQQSAHGLGMFGSAEDAALMDEVVRLAYEERRRPRGAECGDLDLEGLCTADAKNGVDELS
jgi:hypothetical protein